jgi:muconolactone delta-isomerase
MTFLVESQFTTVPTADALALIPAESARGAALDAEGVRLHLFLAADQSKAWQVYRAASLIELQQILASFPLYPYVTTTITPLADGTNT